MKFIDFIKTNRSDLCDLWFKWMLQNYPEPSLKFLSKKDEPFTNPIGYNIYQGINKILDLIINSSIDTQEFEIELESILKIRSLQGLNHWDTINFFELLWNEYSKNLDDKIKPNEVFDDFEFYIKLISKSLSKYIEIKEVVAEIQKNEIRNRYGRILDRLNEKFKYLDENNYQT